MSIIDAVIAEAHVGERPLSRERAEEIAAELASLLEASKQLRQALTFDDQASDFAQALLDHRAGSSASTDQA